MCIHILYTFHEKLNKYVTIMNYKNIVVCIIVIMINITGFECKCSGWHLSGQDVKSDEGPPKGTMKLFRSLLRRAGHIVVLTGAGISTDSGIMTYRGSWGYWRKWNCRDLDTNKLFKNESAVAIVWEYNNYRRDYISSKQPNAAHYAIVELEKYLQEEGKGRSLTLITTNTDGLHTKAGSHNIIELYGTVWKTECTACYNVENNTDLPICPALAHASVSAALDGKDPLPPPDIQDLPHCKKPRCNHLLRPYISFLDEEPKLEELSDTMNTLLEAELVILVGISFSNVTLIPLLLSLHIRNVPIAEFNTQETAATSRADFYFKGRAKDTLPAALNLSDTSDLPDNFCYEPYIKQTRVMV